MVIISALARVQRELRLSQLLVLLVVISGSGFGVSRAEIIKRQLWLVRTPKALGQRELHVAGAYGLNIFSTSYALKRQSLAMIHSHVLLDTSILH